MKVTKEIVEKVVFDYGFDDYAKVVVRKNGAIRIKFEYEQPQMDLIFAISGIVQDVIEASGIDKEYADYVWVIPTKKYISVEFNDDVLQNA